MINGPSLISNLWLQGNQLLNQFGEGFGFIDSPYLEGVDDSDLIMGQVGNIIGHFLRISLVLAAVVLLANLIMAGFSWIASGGDSSKIEKARNRIVQSIIGLIILVSAVAIFTAIQQFLGVSLIRFNSPEIDSPPPADPPYYYPP